jgi:glutaredoxin
MKQPNVSIYGSKNCGDTTRAMRLLEERQIPYEFKDVDQSPELNEYVAGLNHGKRTIPAIQIDNEMLINPSDSELTKALEQAAAKRP